MMIEMEKHPKLPRYKVRQLRMANIGRHPTGYKLAGPDPPGRTCGNCAHRVVWRYATRYHKCNLLMMTHGPATDIKCSWPACEHWKEIET